MLLASDKWKNLHTVPSPGLLYTGIAKCVSRLSDYVCDPRDPRHALLWNHWDVVMDDNDMSGCVWL
jgi:hypothetical protein